MKFTNAPLAAALLPVVAAQTKPCHPPVDSDKLQELIKSDELMKNLEVLNDIAYANGGHRAFGFPGYAASVDYIYGELEKLKGFEIRKQDFPALFVETTAKEFSVDGEVFRSVGLTYSPSTSAEGVDLPIVHAPTGPAGCAAANYAAQNIDAKGKIVLVERGVCPDQTTFAGKLKAAAAAGAAAVAIYNSDPAQLTAGSLSLPNPVEYVPALLIDQGPGRAIKARLDAGEAVTAHFQTTQLIEERITQNVIAETKGGDASNVVMVGAHLDSVQAGPGINDDGSGTTLILELAKALSRFSTNLKVRFAWWGAEENGLWGSKFYVNNMTSAEVDNLLLYVNFDMVSRGFFGVFDGDGADVGPGGAPGSDAIEKLFLDHFESEGVETRPVGLTGGTDYVPFQQVIKKPVGGLFTGTGAEQDACYHQACDNIDNPNPETLFTNAKAAAHVISVLATDGVELVPKTLVNSTSFAAMREIRDEGLHVHLESMKACDHDII